MIPRCLHWRLNSGSELEGSEPCAPFFSWELSDPSDQFFSFVSVGGFVNCANPSSADFACPANGPFGPIANISGKPQRFPEE